jgi:hypothetical protein
MLKEIRVKELRIDIGNCLCYVQTAEINQYSRKLDKYYKSKHSMPKSRPMAPQRALVFQGGGSLGAYEAGVFHVLYHWIKKDLSEDENIFDIIAGTSIGAINASIIVNHFLENKSSDTSSKEELPRKVTRNIGKDLQKDY